MVDLKIKVEDLLLKANKMHASDPQACLEICSSALKISRDNNFKKLEGESYLQMIWAYRITSSYEEALDCADTARKIFTELEDESGLMKLNNLIGILYYYNGIMDLALRHLYDSYEVAKKLKNKNLMIATLNNIGEVKKKAGDLEEAMEIYQQGKELAKDDREGIRYGVIIQNMGDVYMLSGNLEAAEKCFHEAYSCYIDSKETASLSELFLNLGRLYLMRDETSRARSYFETAIGMLEGVHNKFFILDVLIEMYKLDMTVDPEIALEHLKKARTYATNAKIELKLSEIELLFNKHYERKGDFERALYHFKKYHNLLQKLDANNLILKLKILKLEKSLHNQEESSDTVSHIVNQEIEMEKEKLLALESLNKELTYQAFHDNLTKLPNRRRIDKEFDRISKNVKRNSCGVTVGIFMMDIDHFKQVNDNMGHIFGDKCLEAIGKELEKLAEKYGAFAGRYGGEEFIFVREDLDLYIANKIAQDLNEAIRSLDIEYKFDNQNRKLTISVGGLFCESLEEFKKFNLIELADKALYIAKAEGRDKSVLHVYRELEDIKLKH